MKNPCPFWDLFSKGEKPYLMLQGEIIIEMPKLAMEYKFEERDLAENEHRTINTYSNKIIRT